jgi:D-alanine--poly(phosphoribitol) ligase subunit 1
MDLLERIDAWHQRAPDRVAHRSPSGDLTYAELARGSDAVAAYVQRTTPANNSPVVVLGHKEPALLLGFLGCVKVGHPYVPLDRSLPEQRLARIVDSAQARLVLTPPKIAEIVTSAGRPIRTRLTDADTYYVMFTSGSTGEPKGVAITLGCLTSFVDWMIGQHAFGQDRPEVFLNQAPFSFDLSVMDLYLSLATGGTLVSLTADEIGNPRQLYQSLAASEVTTWVSTPSFAQLCLAEKRFDASLMPSVRRFLFCGETLPPAVARQLLDRFPTSEVWNTYGPTEATVATTSVHIDRAVLARYPTLPVGYPKADSRVVVLDPSDRPVAEGKRGEIVIAGPNVSPGYLNRADLTARSFFTLDGWQAYRSGDWGHFEDGLLFYEGRMDSQIKLHGYRIELGDVEANLRTLAGVRDAVVVPLWRDARVDSLAAFVISPEGEAGFAAEQRLRRALASRLPAYMVPQVLKIVDVFPMTPNGKVDRRALADTLA